MNAQQTIKAVSATGAKFVIEGDDIGLTKDISDDLLVEARSHKTEIRNILLALKHPNKSNVVDIARARLIKASHGLDVDIDELMKWYKNDYQRIQKMTTVKQLRVYILDYIRCNYHHDKK